MNPDNRMKTSSFEWQLASIGFDQFDFSPDAGNFITHNFKHRMADIDTNETITASYNWYPHTTRTYTEL